MGYTIDVQPEVGVVVAVWHADFDIETEIDQMDAEMHAGLAALPAPGYLIVDVTRSSIGLKEAIHGTNFAVRGGGTVVGHPNLEQIVVVTKSSLVQLSAKGMNSAAFNFVDLAVFPTLDEALAYAGAAAVPIPGE